MKAIETSFDGRRFRSRTEARWAVFLKGLGLSYEYEPEGFVLDGTPYLPDFRIPEIECWLEVKGQEPTEDEMGKCQRLARESGWLCLLAIGVPQPEPHIIVFSPDPEEKFFDGLRFCFAEDRRTEGKFWLHAPMEAGWPIGPARGEWHDRPPLNHWNVERAFQAAMSARFEFGESGPGWRLPPRRW